MMHNNRRHKLSRWAVENPLQAFGIVRVTKYSGPGRSSSLLYTALETGAVLHIVYKRKFAHSPRATLESNSSFEDFLS